MAANIEECASQKYFFKFNLSILQKVLHKFTFIFKSLGVLLLDVFIKLSQHPRQFVNDVVVVVNAIHDASFFPCQFMLFNCDKLNIVP